MSLVFSSCLFGSRHCPYIQMPLSNSVSSQSSENEKWQNEDQPHSKSQSQQHQLWRRQSRQSIMRVRALFGRSSGAPARTPISSEIDSVEKAWVPGILTAWSNWYNLLRSTNTNLNWSYLLYSSKIRVGNRRLDCISSWFNNRAVHDHLKIFKLYKLINS